VPEMSSTATRMGAIMGHEAVFGLKVAKSRRDASPRTSPRSRGNTHKLGDTAAHLKPLWQAKSGPEGKIRVLAAPCSASGFTKRNPALQVDFVHLARRNRRRSTRVSPSQRRASSTPLVPPTFPP
jgi:hypothetical protein